MKQPLLGVRSGTPKSARGQASQHETRKGVGARAFRLGDRANDKETYPQFQRARFGSGLPEATVVWADLRICVNVARSTTVRAFRTNTLNPRGQLFQSRFGKHLRAQIAIHAIGKSHYREIADHDLLLTSVRAGSWVERHATLKLRPAETPRVPRCARAHATGRQTRSRLYEALSSRYRYRYHCRSDRHLLPSIR